MKTKKVAVTKVSTASGQQVSLQGHAGSDRQARNKICVQKNQHLES
jgi:hypothetical protein